MSTTIKPVSEEELKKWRDCLLDPKAKLADRARNLWGLRHAKEPLAIQYLGDFLIGIHEGNHPASNALLQHEAAYCLGQRQDLKAIDILENVIDDKEHCAIVRHEAGEALAALASRKGPQNKGIMEILERNVDTDVIELKETCQLGIERIKFLDNEEFENVENPYPETIDPSPSFPPSTYEPEKLRDILMDQSKDLFTRYRALFSLRNLTVLTEGAKKEDVEKAASLLSEGLFAQGSALLRHEVAFVLGQVGHPVTSENLCKCLSNVKEHQMVRHEAAEALGTVLGAAKDLNLRDIAKKTDKTLNDYLKDNSQVVRESCVLALDVADYVSGDNFQYVSIPA